MKYFDNSATIWTEHNNKGGQCSTSPINNPAMHQPKLAPRYFGPFIIVRKLSTLSYKLALPATTKATHKQSGNTQVLVQWEGQPKDDTTWVDIADFRGQFPNSNLVHKETRPLPQSESSFRSNDLKQLDPLSCIFIPILAQIKHFQFSVLTLSI
nr:Transposon Tf2-11 polyprotein [Ipomoea batatas]